MNESELMTYVEVGRYLRLDAHQPADTPHEKVAKRIKATVAGMVKRGELKVVVLGKYRMVPRASVVARAVI
jgi:hypothetical protein